MRMHWSAKGIRHLAGWTALAFCFASVGCSTRSGGLFPGGFGRFAFRSDKSASQKSVDFEDKSTRKRSLWGSLVSKDRDWRVDPFLEEEQYRQVEFDTTAQQSTLRTADVHDDPLDAGPELKPGDPSFDANIDEQMDRLRAAIERDRALRHSTQRIPRSEAAGTISELMQRAHIERNRHELAEAYRLAKQADELAVVHRIIFDAEDDDPRQLLVELRRALSAADSATSPSVDSEFDSASEQPNLGRQRGTAWRDGPLDQFGHPEPDFAADAESTATENSESPIFESAQIKPPTWTVESTPQTIEQPRETTEDRTRVPQLPSLQAPDGHQSDRSSVVDVPPVTAPAPSVHTESPWPEVTAPQSFNQSVTGGMETEDRNTAPVDLVIRPVRRNHRPGDLHELHSVPNYPWPTGTFPHTPRATAVDGPIVRPFEFRLDRTNAQTSRYPGFLTVWQPTVRSQLDAAPQSPAPAESVEKPALSPNSIPEQTPINPFDFGPPIKSDLDSQRKSTDSPKPPTPLVPKNNTPADTVLPEFTPNTSAPTEATSPKFNPPVIEPKRERAPAFPPAKSIELPRIPNSSPSSVEPTAAKVPIGSAGPLVTSVPFERVDSEPRTNLLQLSSLQRSVPLESNSATESASIAPPKRLRSDDKTATVLAPPIDSNAASDTEQRVLTEVLGIGLITSGLVFIGFGLWFWRRSA